MKALFVGGLLVIGALGFLLFASSKPEAPHEALSSPTPRVEEVSDINASFAIFTNGTFRVFTASMYHNQSDNVFIESSNPNVVHVRKAHVTWNDFFATLPFSLSPNCLTTGTGQTFCTNKTGSLKFYLNGRPDPSALEREISGRDKLLVSFGNDNETEIEKQLQQVPEAE